MESASGPSYSMIERELLREGMALFAEFARDSGNPLERSATIDRSETKLDKQTGLLLGRGEADICASPQEIVAYTLNYCRSRVGQSFAAADPNTLRSEHLETVHSWHSITFVRCHLPPIQDRTFLMSMVAERVAAEPPTYEMVIVPVQKHSLIGRSDEAGTVRGENFRCYRLTELVPGKTKLEFVCSLDLKGWVPQIITNTVAVPQQLGGV